MASDESVLIGCSDEEMAVVAEEGPCSNTDEAVLLGKPVIIVKLPDLARDVCTWLKMGQYCRRVVIGTALCSIVSRFIFDRLAKVLAVASITAGVSYGVIWQRDPIYSNYHVVEDQHVLAYLGARYRRGTNVVLVKNFNRNFVRLPFLLCVLSCGVAFGKNVYLVVKNRL